MVILALGSSFDILALCFSKLLHSTVFDVSTAIVLEEFLGNR